MPKDQKSDKKQETPKQKNIYIYEVDGTTFEIEECFYTDNEYLDIIKNALRRECSDIPK